jgi:glucose/mannose-6-phosphate isomerase
MWNIDRAMIERVDSTGQLAAVGTWPNQLRDAVRRFDASRLPDVSGSSGFLLIGMGGSGVGGRLAEAVLRGRLRKPFVVCDDYRLPDALNSGYLAVGSTYSGATRETLAALEAARSFGMRRVVFTSGRDFAQSMRIAGVPVVDLPTGFQPRAAIGYALVMALLAAEHCRAAPSVRGEIAAAADLADELVAQWGPGNPGNEAQLLAERLVGTVPVIMGAELGFPVAYRFSCQLAENAKYMAFASRLPEMNHNLIVPWPTAAEQAKFAGIIVEDPDAHPENRLRTELLGKPVQQGAAVFERIKLVGRTRTEALVWGAMFCDYVSLYLAIGSHRDPVDIAPIDELKGEMARRLS